VSPLSTTNTLKLTKTSTGNVFVNQAQVNAADLIASNGVVHSIAAVVLPSETVVDIAIDNGFTSLATAVITAELLPALTNPLATLTVFAPTNDAFDDIAAALGTDVAGLLELPNLADILTYHVLGTEVLAADVTNGAVVAPLSTTNTLKLTKTSTGNVFVNQAQVTTADVQADNGVVHIINAVVLPSETVVDVALDNGFTSLATAVITAELLPALTNPIATLTVFAPTNDAFNFIAAALGTDIAGLLALPNLADILAYHVLGTEVLAADVINGAVVTPLSTTNTLKLTKTSTGNVLFVNQAQVITADVQADNGVVHVLNEVVLPSETVVDVAIDNGFTTLVTAVVAAELLPALTNPLADLTVFAPNNDAFAALPVGVLDGLLTDIPALTEVLLYHVVEGSALAADLSDGQMIETYLGQDVEVSINGSVVTINESEVILADVEADNGVVHVIDAVLIPEPSGLNNVTVAGDLNLYPNPAQEAAFAEFSLTKTEVVNIRITDLSGKTIYTNTTTTGAGQHRLTIPVSSFAKGIYLFEIGNSQSRITRKLVIK
jgi:uncharacterized surface protein with fasciclin (FAS1) repeats